MLDICFSDSIQVTSSIYDSIYGIALADLTYLNGLMISNMSCRKFLCKMIKQVTHSLEESLALCWWIAEEGISAGNLCWKESWDVSRKGHPAWLKRGSYPEGNLTFLEEINAR